MINSHQCELRPDLTDEKRNSSPSWMTGSPPTSTRDASTGGTYGFGQAQHYGNYNLYAPARRTFFLLLFLCASKEKVDEHAWRAKTIYQHASGQHKLTEDKE